MISHDLHRRELLAASEVCTVERCDGCCIVHVHFGAATVRFTSEAFAALCGSLNSALARQDAKDRVRAEEPLGGGIRFQ